MLAYHQRLRSVKYVLLHGCAIHLFGCSLKCVLGLWCVMPLSAIFQLYRGNQLPPTCILFSYANAAYLLKYHFIFQLIEIKCVKLRPT
jgi:hypothetical protein